MDMLVALGFRRSTEIEEPFTVSFGAFVFRLHPGPAFQSQSSGATHVLDALESGAPFGHPALARAIHALQREFVPTVTYRGDRVDTLRISESTDWKGRVVATSSLPGAGLYVSLDLTASTPSDAARALRPFGFKVLGSDDERLNMRIDGTVDCSLTLAMRAALLLESRPRADREEPRRRPLEVVRRYQLQIPGDPSGTELQRVAQTVLHALSNEFGATWVSYDGRDGQLFGVKAEADTPRLSFRKRDSISQHLQRVATHESDNIGPVFGWRDDERAKGEFGRTALLLGGTADERSRLVTIPTVALHSGPAIIIERGTHTLDATLELRKLLGGPVVRLQLGQQMDQRLPLVNGGYTALESRKSAYRLKGYVERLGLRGEYPTSLTAAQAILERGDRSLEQLGWDMMAEALDPDWLEMQARHQRTYPDSLQATRLHVARFFTEMKAYRDPELPVLDNNALQALLEGSGTLFIVVDDPSTQTRQVAALLQEVLLHHERIGHRSKGEAPRLLLAIDQLESLIVPQGLANRLGHQRPSTKPSLQLVVGLESAARAHLNIGRELGSVIGAASEVVSLGGFVDKSMRSLFRAPSTEQKMTASSLPGKAVNSRSSLRVRNSRVTANAFEQVLASGDSILRWATDPPSGTIFHRDLLTGDIELLGREPSILDELPDLGRGNRSDDAIEGRSQSGPTASTTAAPQERQTREGLD